MAPTILEQMNMAVENRKRYFQRMQRCYDLSLDPSNTAKFLIYSQPVDNVFEKYENTIETITALNYKLTGEGVSHRVETEQSFVAFEELYFAIKMRLSALKEAAERPAQSPSCSEQPIKVRLPTITIPSYGGNIVEFPPWRSLYDELIHENQDLSDIQKFSYLRSYLKGEALTSIEAISFTPANYVLAYKTIIERFSRKRLLAGTYLNKILQYEPIKVESASSLTHFLDIFDISVQSLKGLLIPDLAEFILLYLALQVLDQKTRHDFESSVSDKDFPSFKDLVTFVKGRCSILQLSMSSGSQNGNSTSGRSEKQKSNSSSSISNNGSSNKKRCLLCSSKEHSIFKCSKFTKLEPLQRIDRVKELKLCPVCLGSHSRLDCKTNWKCNKCSSTSHHSVLHLGASSSKSNQSSSPSTSGTQLCGAVEALSSTTVLLGTAMIQMQDVNGDWHVARCVVDPGSQISAITERMAQLLGLPRNKCKRQVSGIGSTSALQTKGEIICSVLPHARISSKIDPFNFRAVVLPKIAGELPSSIPTNIIERFEHLQLADTSFKGNAGGSGAKIDFLIGAEYYASVLNSSLPIIQGNPSAIPSKFGWLLMGKVDRVTDDTPAKLTSLFISSQDPVSLQLQRFWEMEELQAERPTRLSPEEISCEDHFLKTHTRDEDGRYIVSLPFKGGEAPILGSNRDIALKRLSSLKNKLNKNTVMKLLYEENLQTYIDANHMIPASEPSNNLLVHHGVFKSSSSTTKLRVVFDPNLKGSGAVSLAESLMAGPKLQKDIGDLLINFRLYPVAITCDIQAMYRSIKLATEDQKYQHILWFGDNYQDIVEYQLTRCTFGLPSSPYQAQRVLKQLVVDEGHKYPNAAKVIDHFVYVDDIVSGGDNIEEVCRLKDEIIHLLELGGFKVRKWASSHSAVLKDIPEEDRETMNLFGESEVIKVLGIQWDPRFDSFCYNTSPVEGIITKRKVLSRIATIFDINGLLAPVVIWLKIFLQLMWLNKDITWDSPLPQALQNKWNTFNNELHYLTDLRIPRYVLSENYKKIDLVGLCDASGNAMAALVYLRIITQNGLVQSRLIRAKTKVAPLKTLSIPRLELCAALMLSKLIRSLEFLLKCIKIDGIHLFTDSMNVIYWIRTPPHLLKIYVANRVTQILELTEPSQWQHVSSKENSADLASRGCMPSEFINNKIWFEGPDFLKQEPSLWPQMFPSENTEHLAHEELKPVKTLIIQETPNDLIQTFEKFSSISTLERVMALVLRFIHNVKSKKTERKQGSITVKEIKEARMCYIKLIQHKYFENEISCIKKQIPLSCGLRFLSPFLDTNNLLLVGGRLSHAPLPFSARHPVLIPAKSNLAVLLINYFHVLSIHGGPKLVQSLLQRQYWIVGCRSLVRRCIHKCIPCFAMKPKLTHPYMADLPISRFSQGRAFLQVGVDLAGPFSLKTGPRRNSPIAKCYFAVFVCMATKAIHIELVTSLTADAFIAALDRFIGRRGLPQQIHSDNGSNFQASAKYLSEVQSFLNVSDIEIGQHLRTKEITWSFIPPSAPSFGGLWEAGVKSIKSHLKYILHEGQAFTFEELYTVLVKIEAILNSRPLCALGSSPDDGVDVLTPGHFLIGSSMIARPEYDFSEDNPSLLKRWQLLSQVSQSFWRRWSTDYLNTLIQRSKWTKQVDGIQVGDLVLVHHTGPTQRWPLGRVLEVFPSSDKVSRVARVKLANGELIRPVHKLAILPLST